MRERIIGLIVLLTLLVCSRADAVVGTTVVDQVFHDQFGNLGNSLNEAYRYVGQSSVMGVGGKIVGVDVWIGRASDGVTNFDCAIAALNASGVPSTLLAYSSIPYQNVPTISGSAIPPVHIDFNAPAELAQGAGFAILLGIQGGLGAGNPTSGNWVGRTGNHYLLGETWHSNNLTTWDTGIGDLYFRTYVHTIPEPAAASGVAFILLALRRRRIRS